MAEMEHARWVVERLLRGWTCGEKGEEGRVSGTWAIQLPIQHIAGIGNVKAPPFAPANLRGTWKRG